MRFSGMFTVTHKSFQKQGRTYELVELVDAHGVRLSAFVGTSVYPQLREAASAGEFYLIDGLLSGRDGRLNIEAIDGIRPVKLVEG